MRQFCPLINGSCAEGRCAWWIEGQLMEKDGLRGPPQCVIQRIADVLRRKGGGRG